MKKKGKKKKDARSSCCSSIQWDPCSRRGLPWLVCPPESSSFFLRLSVEPSSVCLSSLPSIVCRACLPVRSSLPRLACPSSSSSASLPRFGNAGNYTLCVNEGSHGCTCPLSHVYPSIMNGGGRAHEGSLSLFTFRFRALGATVTSIVYMLLSPTPPPPPSRHVPIAHDVSSSLACQATLCLLRVVPAFALPLHLLFPSLVVLLPLRQSRFATDVARDRRLRPRPTNPP